jgi:hypothetical protein
VTITVVTDSVPNAATVLTQVLPEAGQPKCRCGGPPRNRDPANFLRGLSVHSLSAKRHSIRVFQAVSIAPNEHAREAKAVIG